MASSLSKKIHEVTARILTDATFAKEVREAALKAVKGGSQSEEFKRYFEYFASTPGELSAMGNPSEGGCTCNSNTWFTLSSLVGPLYTCCATTTTTTTTGNFFSE
ncbi:MAG: hypothetical protein ACJ74J_00445 [Blastocatellia bacterium]